MKKFLLAMVATMFATVATAAEKPVVTLTPSNVIVLRTQVADDTVSKLILELMAHPAKEVYLYINSPGGSILAGNQFVSALRASGKNVTCIVDFAASMAFSITQACTRRLGLDHAILMQHQASYQARGSVTEVRTTVSIVERLADQLNRWDSERIGMSLKDFQAKIHDEWWLIGADEAVASNVLDSAAYVKCDSRLVAKRENQVIESMFGVVTLVWSGCPLAPYPVSIKMEMKKGVRQRDYERWLETLDLDSNWKDRKVVK
jgi:ATP-dependent Clp protease protease subunit